MRVIPKLNTGFTPIQYLHTIVSLGLDAGGSNAPSSNSDDEGLLSEKVLELLALHALPSDMHAFLNNASILKSSVMGGSISKSPSKVKELLMYMNKMHHELEMFKTNLTRINTIDAQGEAAIADNGGIFVYRNDKVLIISPKLLRAGEKALTNTLIMNIRANSSKYAFDTRLTGALSNATSMKLIRGVIQDVLSKIDEETTKYSTLQSGASEDNSIVGIISTVLLSKKDLARLGADAIIKRSVSNTNNVAAIQNAVKAIYSLLDPSMKTLIDLRAKEASLLYGGKVTPIDMILLYVVYAAKNINETDSNILANPGWEDPNSPSGGLDELNEKMPLTTSAIALAELGYRTDVTINPGSMYEINTRGIISGFTNPSGGSIGNGPLSAITSSELALMLDTNNATIGGIKLNKELFGDIYIGHSNYHMLLMPIDTSSKVIRPDINLVKQVQAVEEELEAKGITDPELVNKYYQSKGLAVKYSGRDKDGKPIINPRAYRKFAAIDVILDELGLPEMSSQDEKVFKLFVKSVDDSVVNSVTARMKKFNEDFEFTGSNYITSNDVWRGTVYIPVFEHMTQAYTGSNLRLSVGEGLFLDKAEKDKNRRNNLLYNNPDPNDYLLNYK